MAYISKNNILSAYKKLSQMHSDPNAQGATQKVSAIRHFLALDNFYKLYNRDCNTRDRNDKDVFAHLVGNISDVCLDLYTTNFYFPLKRHTGDYSVGSNFYSAGQVNASLVNPDGIFDYPKRGNIPLMKIQNGVLKRETSLYQNFNNYIISTDYVVALIVWLIRKISIEQNNGKTLYDNIYMALSEMFTEDLLNVLFKDSIAFEQELNRYDLVFNDNLYIIQETDINDLFDISSLYEDDTNLPMSYQIIFYGAPGTGKSHKIKEILGDYDGCPESKKVPKENIFRITFHPDSDYSTFVGAYKPTMEKQADKIYTKGELISKLTEMKDSGVTYSPQKFGAKYWRSLKQLNLSDKKNILHACDMSDSYTVELDKGAAVGEEYMLCSNESRIIYSFIPQAFLKAYIRAYQTEDNVYLIIEEINRGNCAQIFGDLFQLLDRDANGKSEYSIKADTDLRTFLEEELSETNPGIQGGELCLPSNLYIYATMNTSDQSLFPIDSAFKRRWEMEYVKVNYDDAAKFKLEIDDRHLYHWNEVLQGLNSYIKSETNSTNKIIGNRFAQAKVGDTIDLKTFRDKVLFFLFNDVFKDNDDFVRTFFGSDAENKFFEDLCESDDIQPIVHFIENVCQAENMKEDSDTSEETSTL